MKGRIVTNSGDSRYDVAVKSDNALLQSLIAKKERDLQAVIDALFNTVPSLNSAYTAAGTAYWSAVDSVYSAIDELNQERATLPTPEACIAARESVCDTARSDARQACRDAAVDCRNGCDGDLDCLQDCDDAEDECEAAADAEWERCKAVAATQCYDELYQSRAAIMARYSPIIADRQAAAAALLPPFKAAASALREGNAQRLSLNQALSRLRAIEDRERVAIAWSAQYDDGIAVGTEVSIAKTTRGRYIITSIGATDDCEHDSDALPTYNLFVNAALQTGVETWRPKWRSGRVLAINDDGTLRVEVTDNELFGSLGTRVSRNEIVCVPPQAYFDDGPLDTTQAAREDYDAAREDWVEAVEALDACIAGFDLNGCLADASGCQDTLDQDRLGCLDARSAGITACDGDPGCIAFVEAQYQSCVESAQSNFAGCVEGVQVQCALNQRNHEDQCRANLQPAIDQAVSALAEAEQDLTLAIQRTARPADPCILESVPVEHCHSSNYELGDDVLIEFASRAASAQVAPNASAEAIRAAAMAVWQSARVVGWASDTRQCYAFYLATISSGAYTGRIADQSFNISATSRAAGFFGPWSGSSAVVTWDGNKLAASANYEAASMYSDGAQRVIVYRDGVEFARAALPRITDINGAFRNPHPSYCAFSQDQTKLALGIPAGFVRTAGGTPWGSGGMYYAGRVYEADLSLIDGDNTTLAFAELYGDEDDIVELSDPETPPDFQEKRGLLSVFYDDNRIQYPLWTLTQSRSEQSSSVDYEFVSPPYPSGEADLDQTTSQITNETTYFSRTTFVFSVGSFQRTIYDITYDNAFTTTGTVRDRVVSLPIGQSPDDVCYGLNLPYNGWTYYGEFIEGLNRWWCRRSWSGTTGPRKTKILSDFYPSMISDPSGKSYYATFGTYDAEYDRGFNQIDSDFFFVYRSHDQRIVVLDDDDKEYISKTAVYWDDDARSSGASAPSFIRFVPYRLHQFGAQAQLTTASQELTPPDKYGYVKTLMDKSVIGIVDQGKTPFIEAYSAISGDNIIDFDLPSPMRKLSVLG